jgi:hypothetical protein
MKFLARAPEWMLGADFVALLGQAPKRISECIIPVVQKI